jgi:hypothetical protein
MNNNTDDMREDYSDIFASQTPVRGKYYEQAMRAKRLVQLDSDVLSLFPTAKDVNAALRGLAQASQFVHGRFQEQRLPA